LLPLRTMVLTGSFRLEMISLAEFPGNDFLTSTDLLASAFQSEGTRWLSKGSEAALDH
jgi:hypothetical protein